MNDIENDAIQLFEDQKIRVAWDEQQEKLKQAVLWLHRRTPMFSTAGHGHCSRYGSFAGTE